MSNYAANQMAGPCTYYNSGRDTFSAHKNKFAKRIPIQKNYILTLAVF